MFSSMKKEILFNGLIVLMLCQIFNMKAQGFIDFTTSLILVSAVLLGLYFRVLMEIYLLEKQL
jgi:hypothetical protein